MRLPGVCAVLRLAVRSEAPPRHGVSRRGLEPLAAGHLDLQLVDPVGEARLARDLSRHAIAGGVNHDPDLPRATSAASAWFRARPGWCARRPNRPAESAEIGRASWRERVCQYV